METIEHLLTTASTRALTDGEHAALLDAARHEGWETIKTVTVRLAIGAGAFGVMNLRAATGLREAHARVMSATRGNLRGVRAADRAQIAQARIGTQSCDLSTHAVEQYIRRVRPELGFDAARALLSEEIGQAVALKARTVNGDEQWALPGGGVAVVCRRGTLGCVTVLTESDGTRVLQPDRAPPAHRSEKRSQGYHR